MQTDPLTGLDVLDFEVAADRRRHRSSRRPGLDGQAPRSAPSTGPCPRLGWSPPARRSACSSRRPPLRMLIPDGDLGVGGHGAAGRDRSARSGPLRRFARAEPASALVAAAFLARAAAIFSARFLVRAPPLVAPVRDIALVEPLEGRSSNRSSAARTGTRAGEERVKLRSLLLTALMRVPSTASNSRP